MLYIYVVKDENSPLSLTVYCINGSEVVFVINEGFLGLCLIHLWISDFTLSKYAYKCLKAIEYNSRVILGVSFLTAGRTGSWLSNWVQKLLVQRTCIFLPNFHRMAGNSSKHASGNRTCLIGEVLRTICCAFLSYLLELFCLAYCSGSKERICKPIHSPDI
jgi:hypothetical protein